MGKVFLMAILGATLGIANLLASADSPASPPPTIMPSNPALAEGAPKTAAKLKCEKVNDTLSYASVYPARAFCEPAAMRCFILKHLKEFPKDDPLRLELQDRVEAQVEYELAICEAFLKASKLKVPE